jgi:hypothetical protein
MYNDGLTEQELVVRALKGPQWIRTNHGSLFDRGSADSYYGRARNPHYGGIGGSTMDLCKDLSAEEVREYQAGYDWNEQYGDKKDWG